MSRGAALGAWLWGAASMSGIACARGGPVAAPTAEAEAAGAAAAGVWLTAAQLKAGEIEVAQLTAGPVHDEARLSGRIAFNDQQVAHVFSPVTGRVTDIAAQFGQAVMPGDTLATMDSPDMGQFSSDVERARSALVAAQRGFERQKSLYQAHAGARRDYEAAEDLYLRARAELSRAQQKVDLLTAGPHQAGKVGQRFVLRAPIAGEVMARTIYPGMEVQGQYGGGNPAVELFTIGSLASVWAVGEVFEMDLDRIAVGQTLRLSTAAYPEATFTGTVDYVSAAIDPNTRTARLRCTLANPDRRLRPEMLATLTVAIPVAPVGAVLAVPRRGVFHLDHGTFAFVRTAVDGERSRFERRAITIDEDVSGPAVPVRAGLAPGDAVVVAGGILLADLF